MKFFNRLKPDPQALPPATKKSDPLNIDFKIAAYGRKFRTATFANIMKPEGETEWMMAVAIRPDQWRVTKIIRNPSLPESGHQIRIADENVTFKTAAEKLLVYEASATGMNLVPVADYKDSLGFDHVENFCLREGLIPDADGKLHPTIAGEIVTPGRFNPASIEKAAVLRQQVSCGELDLSQAWNQIYLQDLFQKYDPDLTWKEIELDLAQLEGLKEAVFEAKSAVKIIQLLQKNEQDEKKITADEFIKQTGCYNWHWEKKWVSDQLKNKNLCDGVMSSNVESAEKLTLPEPYRQEIQSFFQDFYIFDLTRRIKLRLHKGAGEITNDDRSAIDVWLRKIRELMTKNGHGPDMIARAERAALNPELFDKIPPEIERQIDRMEAVFIAARDQINHKLGQDNKDGKKELPALKPPA